MALSWLVTYTVKDRKNKTSFVKFHVQYEDDVELTINTFAQVEAVALDIAPEIDDMITGAITNISISRDIPLPVGIKVSPSTTSDIEEKGVFVFKTLVSKPRVTVPTIRDSYIVDGTDLIDTSQVAVFLFLMTDGSGSPSEYVRPSDSRDAVIFGYEKAYEKFKS